MPAGVSKSLTSSGTLPIELGAKSLILQVYDVLMNDRGFRASDCGASETREARLRARAETGQTWQPSYSRPACRLPCEVVDFKAGQDYDEAQLLSETPRACTIRVRRSSLG